MLIIKLCFPVIYVGITNGYSISHQAIDLGWHYSKNEPILACFNGVVSNIYTDDKYGGGLTLTIKYDNGYSSDFKHLSKVTVKVGDRVNQFDEVAIMGNSGWNNNGTHLHFNLYEDGKRVNPLQHCYLYPNQECSDDDKDKIMIYGGEDMKFKIGDKVIVSGNLYSSSDAKTASGKVNNKTTTITRVMEGSLHPYNTTGDLGWMDEKDIVLYEESEINYKKLYENELLNVKNLEEQLNIANNKIKQAINILQ